MPKFPAEIAGRLQPKRLACKYDVHHNEHQPHQHHLTASALLRCRQWHDGEDFWFVGVICVTSNPDVFDCGMLARGASGTLEMGSETINA